MADEAGAWKPDIVVVTHFFPSHGGGIELVAARLVDEYVSAGHRVEWFASSTDIAPPDSPRFRAHPIRASNAIERITQLPYPLWGPSAIPRLWKAIRSARAVHVHEHLYVGSIAAIVIGRLLGKVVVLTQHMGALIMPVPCGTTLYTAAAKALALPMMRLPTRIVFISANVMHFFRGLGRQSSRGQLIYNGLDSEIFRFSGDEQRRKTRAELGLDPDSRVVVFAGRFVRKKGLNFLRRLAEAMGDVTWLFAGSGPDDPAAWQLSNVKALGRLSQQKLSQVFSAADALILPSTGEGFPLVVQEALACGTAVVSTPEVASACPEALPLIQAETFAGNATDLSRWESTLRQQFAVEADTAQRQFRAARAAVLWSWKQCATTYLAHLLPASSERQ